MTPPTPVSRGRKGFAESLHLALPELIAGGLPLAWLVFRSPAVLSPNLVSWLGRGDAASHFIGWLFFGSEPWQWPPARIGTWLVPQGTTIGMADAIPLLAFPLKFLAHALPGPFQYFGLWFAACLVLQGVLASRLLEELGAGRSVRALGGALLGFSPVVWQRFDVGHFSLCAQWLILAAFLAWVRFFRSGGATRYLVWLATLPVLAATIHPYLTLITGALLAAIVPASWRFGWRRVLSAASLTVAAAAASVAVAVLVGFLGSGTERLRAGDWGGYAADLGTFVNPGSRSRFVPALVLSSGSAEGFAYLGAGGLLIGLAGLLAGARERRLGSLRSGSSSAVDRHGWRALWFACGLLAAVAALPNFRIFGADVVSARGITEGLSALLGPFRANGRLIWPLHLLLIVSALRWVRPLSLKPKALNTLLALALVLEAWEPVLTISERPWPRLVEPNAGKWQELFQGVTKVSMLPVYLRDGAEVYCGESVGTDAWVQPAFVASRLGASFDCGYVARLDAVAARSRCADGEKRLAALRLNPSVLYVVRPSLARSLTRNGATCELVAKRLWACREPA